MSGATEVSAEAKGHFEEGLRLSHHPDHVEKAAEAFRRAIAVSADYRLAYLHLGDVYYRWSHFADAIDPLNKAIELDPEDPGPYYMLGRSYNEIQRYSSAEDALRKFIAMVPNYANAHYQLGYAALMQFGKQAEAIKHFREAVRLNPRHGKAYYFLGSTLVDVGDLEGARQVVEQQRGVFPEQAERLANHIAMNETQS